MYYMHYIMENFMTYSIRFPQEVEKRLQTLAETTGRTKSFYVKEAVLEHLNDIEDIYLAQKRLEKIRSGISKTVSLEKVMKKYDMES